jgi:uncharacterized alkaline shock family protein YloU
MSEAIAGTLRVSNGCIADIAGYAAMECYGVVGMAEANATSGAPSLLPHRKLRRGVEVATDQDGVHLDLHVIVERGMNLNSVAENLVSSVKYLLNEVAQIGAVDVKVHVEGMRTS